MTDITGCFPGRDQFLESRPGAIEEFLAGLGQAHAACRADEQRRAQASFQRAYRLAYGGWRHIEVGGGAAEVAMPRDSQEHLDSFQGAMPDCVVLLHGLL